MTRAILERKTRADLMRLAKRAGLRGISLLKKAQLVEALLRTTAAPPLRRHAKKKPATPRRRSPAKKEKKLTVKPKRKPAPKPKAKPVTMPAPAAAPSPVPAAPAVATKKSAPLTELPAVYGKTGLVLMEVDPRHLHVYWEVTPADRDAAQKKAGTGSTWVLRFYDTTFIHFDGTNAHSYFDVPVDLSSGNWYLELWAGEKTYCAEIGPRSAAGKFVSAARSNFIEIPRGEQSPTYRPEWAKVERPTAPPPPVPVLKQLATTESLPSTPPTPTEPKTVTEQKVRRHYEQMVAAAVEVPAHSPSAAKEPFVREIGPMPGTQKGPVSGAPSSPASSSFGLGGSGGSMFPGARPSIDLKLNTEIVVSGRAQPGQTVQLNGRWIKVNEDGTFSVRLALPVAQD